MTKVVRFSVFVLAAVMGMATAAPVMAQAGGEPADDVKITRYNDWEVRCPKSGPAQNDCEMTQLINGPDGNKPIMRVVMGYPPQIDSAAMIFILPPQCGHSGISPIATPANYEFNIQCGTTPRCEKH